MNPFDQVVSVADNITKENHSTETGRNIYKRGQQAYRQNLQIFIHKLVLQPTITMAYSPNTHTHTNIVMLYWVMIFIETNALLIDFRKTIHGNKLL